MSDRDDGECGSNGDKDDFDPKLVITNLEETRKETQWRSCEQDPDDPDVTYVTMHWRIKGVFYENMELENFPRDVSSDYCMICFRSDIVTFGLRRTL